MNKPECLCDGTFTCSTCQDAGLTQFPVGTKYMTRGKHSRECTVRDSLRTYNSDGFLVAIRYITTHEFMGQTIFNKDVVGATIAMGNPRIPE